MSRPSEVIPKLVANDPSLTEVNFNDNATYQMKSADYTKQIADALGKNTNVKRVTLAKLNLTDQSVSLIAESLKINKSVTYLDVANNKFGNSGLIAIAEALKVNNTVVELSVIGQSQPFGESGLTKMTDMFEYNITLQKINWRLHSRQSFALNKLISRNVDIKRRIAAGQKLEDYINFVPGPRKPDFGVASNFIATEGGPTTEKTPATEEKVHVTEEKSHVPEEKTHVPEEKTHVTEEKSHVTEEILSDNVEKIDITDEITTTTDEGKKVMLLRKYYLIMWKK